MKREHIQFEDWEPGTAVDESHLAECEACRLDYRRARFLAALAATAPEPEISPFFASRVAQLAAAGTRSFWEVLDRMARRLVPALASLVLVAGALLLWTGEPVDFENPASLGWLVEGEEAPAPATLDDMLLVLAQADWEEVEDEGQH